MLVEQRPWSLHGQLPDLVSSDIGLAPLPDNRYTRGKCGFKILQYAAAGLPSVASPVGVNAGHVQHGVTGFHATGSADWIETLTQLIQDTPLRTRMGRAAQERVTSFDERRIAEQLGTIFKEHLTER
jgi:glycosyltransferase involved in cell wall biosynthesis